MVEEGSCACNCSLGREGEGRWEKRVTVSVTVAQGGREK